MTNIPANIARVPNSLGSQILFAALERAQKALLDTEIQLATGRLVNRASDNPLATSVISVLDDVIERRDQRLRNLSHADSVLNNVDAALAEATDLLMEAKGIASSQIGVGSDAEIRKSHANVIDSLLTAVVGVANREFQQVHLFGGAATAEEPMIELLGGFRYRGEGNGFVNDLGLTNAVPITMSGADAFGALSARVEGNFDLDPTMTANTILTDLNGARGLGVTVGEMNVDVGGTLVVVDLSTAHTVGDVVSMLEAGIQTVDPGATVAISAAGDSFEITPSAGVDVTITDLTAGTTAADLGLDLPGPGFPGGAATAGNDVDPLLSEQTLLSSLPGVTYPLGTIRLSNAGQTRDLDLSAATNVQDLINEVKGLNIGIRVEIAASGDRLNFINELSGGQMSVGEVGGGMTATELGVRSMAEWTRLEDFNNGRGVQIKTGGVDPVTGLPDPATDVDFRITMKDASTLDVDLTGAETVGDVLAMINGAATIAGVPITASLAADGNGIAITDATVGPGNTLIEAANGSFAAEDLGLLGETAGATLNGEDRSTVAVESVFSHLLSLREALLANDERSITFAAEKFDADISRLAEARAEVGVRGRLVADTAEREEDLKIQDQGLRSAVQDLDYTEASLRFTTLQQQLQAGLLTARQVTSLSLLDFLT